jgi:hypothetical protein
MGFSPYKPREYGSTKDIVTRLVDQAGGIKAAAFILGKSATQAQAYTDPARPDDISFDDVRRLAAAIRSEAVAEDAASLAGGEFIPGSVPKETFANLSASAAHDWGGFTASVIRAMADGRIDRLEKAETLRGLDTIIRAMVSARLALQSETH